MKFTKYPFSEKKYLKEVEKHIIKCNTSGNYTDAKKGKNIHTWHLISQGPHMRGLHYSIGSAQSYLDRFGTKGGLNRLDIIKAIHFLIFALFCYDNYGPEKAIEEEVIEK